jgi:4-methyl-5(b-hydroxyethyl)-thiazole monophosphate biosynthesis
MAREVIMTRVLVPLAAGFEELEAVTLIDLLRRAGFEVVVAGLVAGPVFASRGTVLVPDTTLAAVADQAFDLVVLPGGLPGADHLAADPLLRSLLQRQHAQHRLTAAICAAPKVLAAAGLLAGKSATCYPGAIDAAAHPDITLVTEPVVTDGTVVTSRGPGTAMDFALALIERLAGRARRDDVETKLLRPGA